MQFVIDFQDNEGVEHQSVSKVCLFSILMYEFISKVSFQAIIEALKKESASIFNIKSIFQIILFGDMQIQTLSGPLAQIGTVNSYLKVF